MTYIVIILAVLAAVLHVYIFYLETLAWMSPTAQKTFGLSKEEAEQTKAMAANQGVYNLLLAVIALVGVLLMLLGSLWIGLALIIAGCGAMSGAALFLLLSSSKKVAALKQLLFPLLGVISALIVALNV